MKIKNVKRKRKYLVKPHSDEFKIKRFKYKVDCIKYLISMGFDALNSSVSISISGLSYSNTLREYLVWYDKHKYNKHGIFELKLVQEDFMGDKYISPPRRPTSKVETKYFIFSDKICNLMSYIGVSESLNVNNLSNLLILFNKRGFKDFIPEDDYSKSYISNNLEKNTLNGFGDWFYWSDRCNFVRCKVIHDLIKRDNPIAFELYEKKLKHLK